MIYNTLKNTRRVLIGITYLLIPILGVQITLFGASSGLLFGSEFLLYFVLLTFCIVDSQMREKALLHSHQFIMYLTLPIAFPIYIIWTRKLKGLLLLLLHIILSFIVYLISIQLTSSLL